MSLSLRFVFLGRLFGDTIDVESVEHIIWELEVGGRLVWLVIGAVAHRTSFTRKRLSEEKRDLRVGKQKRKKDRVGVLLENM